LVRRRTQDGDILAIQRGRPAKCGQHALVIALRGRAIQAGLTRWLRLQAQSAVQAGLLGARERARRCGSAPDRQ
jgi:hypothetical protein